MDEKPPPPDSSDGFMKRAKDALSVLILASMCWFGHAVQESTTQIAVLSEQIRELQGQVIEAKGNAADRYSASSASADKASLQSLISQSNSRIDEDEKRIRDLELMSVHRK